MTYSVAEIAYEEIALLAQVRILPAPVFGLRLFLLALLGIVPGFGSLSDLGSFSHVLLSRWTRLDFYYRRLRNTRVEIPRRKSLSLLIRTCELNIADVNHQLLLLLLQLVFLV